MWVGSTMTGMSSGRSCVTQKLSARAICRSVGGTHPASAMMERMRRRSVSKLSDGTKPSASPSDGLTSSASLSVSDRFEPPCTSLNPTSVNRSWTDQPA